MRKSFKKVFAGILALSLLSSMSSIVASADDNTSTAYTLGDINQDGTVNVADLLAVKKVVLGITEATEVQEHLGDVNQDGELNTLDLLGMKRIILGISEVPSTLIYIDADGNVINDTTVDDTIDDNTTNDNTTVEDTTGGYWLDKDTTRVNYTVKDSSLQYETKYYYDEDDTQHPSLFEVSGTKSDSEWNKNRGQVYCTSSDYTVTYNQDSVDDERLIQMSAYSKRVLLPLLSTVYDIDANEIASAVQLGDSKVVSDNKDGEITYYYNKEDYSSSADVVVYDDSYDCPVTIDGDTTTYNLRTVKRDNEDSKGVTVTNDGDVLSVYDKDNDRLIFKYDTGNGLDVFNFYDRHRVINYNDYQWEVERYYLDDTELVVKEASDIEDSKRGFNFTTTQNLQTGEYTIEIVDEELQYMSRIVLDEDSKRVEHCYVLYGTDEGTYKYFAYHTEEDGTISTLAFETSDYAWNKDFFDEAGPYPNETNVYLKKEDENTYSEKRSVVLLDELEDYAEISSTLTWDLTTNTADEETKVTNSNTTGLYYATFTSVVGQEDVLDSQSTVTFENSPSITVTKEDSQVNLEFTAKSDTDTESISDRVLVESFLDNNYTLSGVFDYTVINEDDSAFENYNKFVIEGTVEDMIAKDDTK